MNTSRELTLDDLRTERRRLAEQVARLVWLRRLVGARRDLEVARLSGMAPAPGELEPLVAAALAFQAATGPELLRALHEADRCLALAASDVRGELELLTGELVLHYAGDPARCLSAGRPCSGWE